MERDVSKQQLARKKVVEYIERAEFLKSKLVEVSASPPSDAGPMDALENRLQQAQVGHIHRKWSLYQNSAMA